MTYPYNIKSEESDEEIINEEEDTQSQKINLLDNY